MQEPGDRQGRRGEEDEEGSKRQQNYWEAIVERLLPPLVPDDDEDDGEIRVADQDRDAEGEDFEEEEEEDDEDYVEGIDADIAADARDVEDLVAERYGRDYRDEEEDEEEEGGQIRGHNARRGRNHSGRGESESYDRGDEWQRSPYVDPDSIQGIASSSHSSRAASSASSSSFADSYSSAILRRGEDSPDVSPSSSPSSSQLSATTLRYLESLRNADASSSSSSNSPKQGAKRRGRVSRRIWTAGNAEDLFMSSRAGDLTRVRWLVEGLGLRVNQRDRWDSTPLYYACLAGHLSIVRYLLQSGARCEANTFDGERCLHGALTDEIRKVLREYKAVALLNDPFSRFLHNLFLAHTDELRRSNTIEESTVIGDTTEEDDLGSDIRFMVGSEEMKAHRCILACRSTYFREMLNTAWANKPTIIFSPSRMNGPAFRACLQFVYTERLETSRENIKDCYRIARQARLGPLQAALHKEQLKEQLEIELPERAVLELADVYGCISGLTHLQRDLAILALRSVGRAFGLKSVPAHPPVDSKSLKGNTSTTTSFVDVESNAGSWFEDIRFCVAGKHFDCHKFFFNGRSEYFKALLTGNFVEGQKLRRSSDALSMRSSNAGEERVELASLVLSDLSPEAFAMIVDFMYTNSMTNALALLADLRHERSRHGSEKETNEESGPKEDWLLLFETLQLADMYMLPVLKNQCVTYLNECINTANVWGLFKTAQLYGLGRLEAACIDFASLNLDQVIGDVEFEELVRESAMSIKDRQEIDTIPIIDEMRTAIYRIYIELDPAVVGRQEMINEGRRRIELIDVLLDKLGLQA